MFNISKVMSTFSTVNPGLFAGILKQAVPAMSQALNTQGLLEGFTKILGGGPASAAGAVQQIAQAIAGKAGLGAAANLQSLPAALTKAMYVSVLLEAVEDAREKQHFNVETAINDLWIKLAKVRPAQNQQLDQTLQQVSAILKQRHDMQMNVIRNLRG